MKHGSNLTLKLIKLRDYRVEPTHLETHEVFNDLSNYTPVRPKPKAEAPSKSKEYEFLDDNETFKTQWANRAARLRKYSMLPPIKGVDLQVPGRTLAANAPSFLKPNKYFSRVVYGEEEEVEEKELLPKKQKEAL